MRYRIKSLAESAAIAERNIAAIREDLRVRLSTRGDDFAMTVQKETFTDRTKAGRALVFLAASMKPFQTTKAIGTIAGFPISLQRLDARTTVTIQGKNAYDANVSDNALGSIASLEHALGSLDERLASVKPTSDSFSGRARILGSNSVTPSNTRRNWQWQRSGSRRSLPHWTSLRIKRWPSSTKARNNPSIP
jgi:hypothetical protein